ncbi:S-adenosyl-L-methionine-dependent methyltransferase [Peniophora sp. CONT]|nr:S-adenosyl-L-methionine-dependent methyltransferase [Peniophora sp. CONT]
MSLQSSSAVSGDEPTHSNYWHIKHANLDSEVERLDGLHHGLKKYMNGKLCLAQLGFPKKILELGAGTGIWAAEAATIYPDADVLATDISPLPPRPLPPNVSFKQFDLLKEFPAELKPGTYDVIHARFLFIHIPNPFEIFSRILPLLAPGGHLLIEDISVNADVKGDVPAIRSAYTALVRAWEDAGQNPLYASQLSSFLEKEGLKVGEDHVVLPISPLSDEPKIRGLGETLRTSWNRSFDYEPSEKLVNAGYTREMHAKRKEEMANGTPWEYHTDLYFTWAQREE